MKIVLDLDGTVIKKDGSISMNLLNYFRSNAKKLDVSICTGRFSDYVSDVAKKLNLTSKYHICDGGAKIIDTEGDTSWFEQLDPGAIEVAHSLKNSSNVEVFFSDIKPNFPDAMQAQVIIRSVKSQALEATINGFAHLPVDVQAVWYWEGHGHTLSVTPKGINKGTALHRLANMEKFSLDKCVIIADGDNDIPCFEVCGTKIAMGNASGNLRKLADYCVDTVDNDGVIQAIESIFNS